MSKKHAILIELIAIIVSMVYMALTFQGGSRLQFFSIFLDLPSLICILLLSLPILARNGLFKDFVRAFKMQSKKFTCSLSDMKRRIIDYMEEE